MKKILRAEGLVVPVSDEAQSTGGRPARVYRSGPAELMHPPFPRLLDVGFLTVTLLPV